MKLILVGIRGLPSGAARRVRAQDVVIRKKVIISQRLGRLGVVSHSKRVCAYFCLRENDSDTHGIPPLIRPKFKMTFRSHRSLTVPGSADAGLFALQG